MIMMMITMNTIMTIRRVAVEPFDYERNLRKTLNILSKLPKTLVILLAPIQVITTNLIKTSRRPPGQRGSRAGEQGRAL